MKDSQGLELTVTTPEALAAVNESTEILFRKKGGIEKVLPVMADKHLDCPILQIYSAIMFFFSFSRTVIKEKFPLYLSRINPSTLNERETIHYMALQKLFDIDFDGAITEYQKLASAYPNDKVTILMLETCAFMAGRVDPLVESYALLHSTHPTDPDFLGMLAFLYCHINRRSDGNTLVRMALERDPNNAWVQHVLAHTLSEENPSEISEGIAFLERCTDDWPKQNRFFQGHNWMHLCSLYLKQGRDAEPILDVYAKNIWGEAKEFNFEQNNAFLTLWNIELAGYKRKIPEGFWADLAKYAEPFMDDYFTPYLTVTAILAVAKVDFSKAEAALARFETFANSHAAGSANYLAWHETALPVLKGCMAYIQGNNEKALEFLEPIHDKTRPMGHSDEQRSIFTGIYNSAKKLVAEASTALACSM